MSRITYLLWYPWEVSNLKCFWTIKILVARYWFKYFYEYSKGTVMNYKDLISISFSIFFSNFYYFWWSHCNWNKDNYIIRWCFRNIFSVQPQSFFSRMPMDFKYARQFCYGQVEIGLNGRNGQAKLKSYWQAVLEFIM